MNGVVSNTADYVDDYVHDVSLHVQQQSVLQLDMAAQPAVMSSSYVQYCRQCCLWITSINSSMVPNLSKEPKME
jgi:hypothetical protein